VTVRPKRELGQHFLADENILGVIGRLARLERADVVLEIGPGLGVLTRYLADRVALVHSVELDRSLEPGLTASLGDRGNVRLHWGDALALDLAALDPAPTRLVANLPYNVATPLLIRWLENIDAFAGLTLMFQKEVADRLTARPRTKDYGRLSVLTQWLTEPRRLFDIPARAFTPPPKVTSTVVQLTPRPAPLHPADRPTLERVTAAAFGQRRKMLRQSLKTLTADPTALLARAGVLETARAEELDVGQFCALARALEA
jgi:16S rRNA (adenine1518-N6/adenine1519-N6)-dimethyltransferase